MRRGEALPADLTAPVIYHLDNIRGARRAGRRVGRRRGARPPSTSRPPSSCAATGDVDAISTAPINKRALFLGGYSFPGHTEFLAHLTGATECAMAFVASNLRIVLISTHVPLAEAIRLVEKERIVRVARLTERELRRWGIERPRIAVAALNPHGAEGGLFGVEEAAEIMPGGRGVSGADGLGRVGAVLGRHGLSARLARRVRRRGFVLP